MRGVGVYALSERKVISFYGFNLVLFAARLSTGDADVDGEFVGVKWETAGWIQRTR